MTAQAEAAAAPATWAAGSVPAAVMAALVGLVVLAAEPAARLAAADKAAVGASEGGERATVVVDSPCRHKPSQFVKNQTCKFVLA